MTIQNRTLIFTLFAGSLCVLDAAEPITRGKITRSRAESSSQHSDTNGLISTPLLGLFVDDANTEVHAVTGVPGSALVSNPLAMPDSVKRVWLAPGQQWALVDAGGLAVLPLDGFQAGDPVFIDGAVSTADAVGFAPQTAVFVVYSRSQERLNVIANGQVTADISTSGLFASPIRSVAIDDSGKWPIAVTEDGAAYRVQSASAPQLLYRGGSISAAVFTSSRLILADDGLSQVIAVEGLTDNPSVRVLATKVGAGAIFLQASTGGGGVIATAAASRSAYRIGFAGEVVESFDLPADPTRLVRLRNRNSFVFSALPAGPVWMLVDDGGTMQATFAARPSKAQETSEPIFGGEVRK